MFSVLINWSWWTDSNPWPADYKSAALPTELHQRIARKTRLVTHRRFELRTPWLKVKCSANWANESYSFNIIAISRRSVNSKMKKFENFLFLRKTAET